MTLTVKGTTMSKIAWKVNNNKASITSGGILTGNSAGNVKVTATMHKKKYNVTIKVENPRFKRTSYNVKAGKVIKVPLSGTKQKMRISYSIGYESIAAIMPDGRIAGLSPGTTTLSASLSGKTFSTQIVVK